MYPSQVGIVDPFSADEEQAFMVAFFKKAHNIRLRNRRSTRNKKDYKYEENYVTPIGKLKVLFHFNENFIFKSTLQLSEIIYNKLLISSLPEEVNFETFTLEISVISLIITDFMYQWMLTYFVPVIAPFH